MPTTVREASRPRGEGAKEEEAVADRDEAEEPQQKIGPPARADPDPEIEQDAA
jgi:hypothetical protein